jgi:hypothetical protein
MYYSLIIKHFKFDLYEWGLDASEMGFYKAFSIFHFKQINLIFKKVHFNYFLYIIHVLFRSKKNNVCFRLHSLQN